MHRFFVGIDLPTATRDRLAGLCRGIFGARWLQPDQLHLTLRFIGEVDGPTFHDVAEALGAIRLPRFELQLKGVGHFPSRGKPRLLWAGVMPSDMLTRLRNAIERAVLDASVVPYARRFTPHVTLVRLMPARRSEIPSFLPEHNLFASAPIPISELYLYSSWLGSKQALHRIEASYPLLDLAPADHDAEWANRASD